MANYFFPAANEHDAAYKHREATSKQFASVGVESVATSIHRVATSNRSVATSKHREAVTIRSVATSDCSVVTFIHFTLFTIHFSLLTTGPVPLDNGRNRRIIVLQQIFHDNLLNLEVLGPDDISKSHRRPHGPKLRRRQPRRHRRLGIRRPRRIITKEKGAADALAGNE